MNLNLDLLLSKFCAATSNNNTVMGGDLEFARKLCLIALDALLEANQLLNFDELKEREQRYKAYIDELGHADYSLPKFILTIKKK